MVPNHILTKVITVHFFYFNLCNFAFFLRFVVFICMLTEVTKVHFKKASLSLCILCYTRHHLHVNCVSSSWFGPAVPWCSTAYSQRLSRYILTKHTCNFAYYFTPSTPAGRTRVFSVASSSPLRGVQLHTHRGHRGRAGFLCLCKARDLDLDFVNGYNILTILFVIFFLF